ncbi:hypothetical protein MASR2M70_08370 [Bacillota bacterium]
MKVLVVTASEADRTGIGNMLESHSLSYASYGFEALRQIEIVADINVVIIDLALPNNDSLNLIEYIRKDSRYNNLIILMLSGITENEKETRGFRLGADDYVRKPFNGDSLNAVINIYGELIEQRAAKLKNIEQQSIFDAVFQQAPIGIAISRGDEQLKGENNEYFSVNAAYERITGRKQDELFRLGWAEITHPDDLEEEMVLYEELQSGIRDSYSMEKRFIRPDGSHIWVHISTATLILPNEHKHNLICMVQDISTAKKTEQALLESERSKSVLLSHFPGMAYRCNYDRDWTMEFVSKGCKNLTGYTEESLLYNRDVSFNDLIAPEYRERIWKEWEQTISKRKPIKLEYEIITSAQKRKWVMEMGEGVYDDKDEVEALEGIILDISGRKKMEEELRYNSEHDTWTGLNNRIYFDELLKHELKKNNKYKKAIISVNLSGLHVLSMSYGFYYHQSMVKNVAAALSAVSGDNCSLYHTSENRFIFYIKKYKDKEELSAFCQSISEILRSLLSADNIGGGLGIVEINNRHEADRIIKNSMLASEKALGIFESDFGHCFFDKDMEVRIMREEQIKLELSQIAAGDRSERLFLQFQPIMDLKSNRICGFEALARLQSEALGLVSPFEFIPIAEATKLIIPLGEIIIRKSFDFLNSLKEKGFPHITLSINVSAIQLLGSGFVKKLFAAMKEMKVNPGNVCLEITETTFSSNYQELNRVLGELKESGIKSAIDDFGIGYSSLAREWELNVNELKIDRYFISRLLALRSFEEAITGDIISMAHKIGHLVVAEGVEEEIQKQYLMERQCDKIQGYLLSRPLDHDAAIDFLEADSTGAL